ncbi:DUF2505 domain-containing protein [Actinokineospora diospyrosa]|uniref:DUF2505 domain-containing protein n=1 Tax=Actinokineospora diospyrosa TaxID=103728 RepID=A0ABT1IHV3_9PSEU|nr:DUF2505 domain-containing protein [Actinokineospora diospyrosa]MCP2272189.1 Protein of unknown function (DUF2505) [Actinokineospora diospyrosa]
MASRIEHRAEFTAPAATVHARLVDRAFLEARLRAIGGKDATLVEHTTTGDATHYRLRQGIDSAHLPSAVRSLVKGDLVVERTETWRPEGTGFTGTTAATVSGIPGDIKGRYTLTDTATGSELRTTAEVKVRIPLIGGKIESVIADRVRDLLTTEARFAESS